MPRVHSTIVELCVFKRSKKGLLFLLLKRSANEKIYPGMWQIITGRMRKKENSVHAALRELREESGLVANRFWVAPVVGSFLDAQKDTIELCPLFAAEVPVSARPKLSREHQAFKWAPYQQARQLLVWPGHRDAIRLVRDYIATRSEASRLTEINPAIPERKKP